MKSYRGYAEFVGRLRRPARFWLRSLQAAAVALLLALPIGTKANAAVPAQNGTAAHVYLLRGVLNVFSLGLDEIAARLQAQGIPVTVVNYLGWASLADEAAAEYRAGRVKTIILVGHSSGATVLPDMVARLDQLGAPVKLAIGLDSVFRTSLSGRVGKYINFYIANGNGRAYHHRQERNHPAEGHRRDRLRCFRQPAERGVCQAPGRDEVRRLARAEITPDQGDEVTATP